MARKGPLRKVVETKMVDSGIALGTGGNLMVAKEVLECGHQQRILKDCFGEFYSYRRRCGKCLPEDAQ